MMFILRRVVPEDREEILSFTADTWDWGDYIPYIFDEWLDPKNGDFLKAVLGAKIVGVSHIGYLSSWEAWLEGLRVHHNYRKIGVGTFLLDASLEILKEKKIKVARNVIASTNIASQNLSRKRGFGFVGEFMLFTKETAQIDVEGLRVATLEDIAILLKIARDEFEKIPSLKKVGAYWNWEWQELTPTAIERMINKALVLIDMNSRGFGVIRKSREDVEITSLYGDFEVMKKILDSGLNLGYESKIRNCEVIVPKEWIHKEELCKRGFKDNPREHTLLVFEKFID